MPETSQQWYDRVAGAIERDGYRPWVSAGWSTWPFEGELTMRALEPPAPDGPARDVLPARDPADLRADIDLVAARLVELAGGRAFEARR